MRWQEQLTNVWMQNGFSVYDIKPTKECWPRSIEAS